MISVETTAVLFGVGLAAGVVDAIAGGGGLLTLPALLLAGLSPVEALATNKIQALASVASSAHRYIRSGVVDTKALRAIAAASVVGAGLGARIFVRYLMDESIVQPGRTIELEIPEEDRQGGLTWNTARARLPSRRDGIIEITAPHVPRFGLDAVRADPAHASAIRGENGSTEAPRYTFTALSAIGTRIFGSSSAWSSSVPLDIGNPHCVTFVARADHMPTLKALHANDGALHDIAFAQAAPEPVFGNGANLQWVWPESRNRLRVMIYERGEGPTLASGSSACAVACAAFGLGLVDADVDVVMPGGTLAIRLRGRGAEIGSVTLAGNADRVLEGTVSVSLQHAT